MKFVKALLTLLATTSVFGISAEQERQIEVCTKELHPHYYKCLYSFTGYYIEDNARFCKFSKNNGCYDFYMNLSKIAPSCVGVKDFYNNGPFEDYDFYAAALQLYCETNNEGNACEAGNLTIFGLDDSSESQKMIDDNCKTKRCNDAFQKVLKADIDLGYDDYYHVNAYNYITSSECTSKAVGNNATSGKCGPGFGKCAKANDCCSKYGYCGTDETYCGTGCQSEFGVCGTNTSNNNNDNFNDYNNNNSIPVSTEKGRCGPEFGKCAKANECCSKYGYCGTSTDHCGTGCQSEFGACSTNTNTNVSISTVKGRCGPDYGKCANSNECCSKYGYCGTSTDHCGTGCQSEFGACGSGSGSGSSNSNVPISTVNGRCGSEYGRCPFQFECCSQYGYCGFEIQHCDPGCQPKYGICY